MSRCTCLNGIHLRNFDPGYLVRKDDIIDILTLDEEEFKKRLYPKLLKDYKYWIKKLKAEIEREISKEKDAVKELYGKDTKIDLDNNIFKIS